MSGFTQKTQTGGNTKTPVLRGRKWVFTLNNYSEQDTQHILGWLKRYSSKWVFGFEEAETGTPHIQGYSEFKNAKSLDVLKKNMSSRAHFERAKGTLKQNYDYTTKDGNYRYGGFNPDKIAWTCCIKHLYHWQEKVINIINEKPDNRTIHWFWEAKGNTGKTTLQKHIMMNFAHVLPLSGKGADMKMGVVNYLKTVGELPEIILINIPRTNLSYLSYTGMEEVKDMFFFSGKYEGGVVCGPSPHILCFANEPPISENVSLDRWKIHKIGSS